MSENHNHNQIEELKRGLKTAFIDSATESNLAYKPEFIRNSYLKGEKILTTIEQELLSCEEFSISVAFITKSGVTPLLQTFKELEARGIKGRILTTDYLTFSEPDALKTLSGLKNISLRMYQTDDGPGFHTKGYVFQKEGMYRILIGSANMTQSALTVNQEWNTKVVSSEQGEFSQKIMREFQELWDSECSLEFDEFYDQYCTRYETIQTQRKIARQQEIVSLEAYRLKPNSMQIAFIDSLRKLIGANEQRGLLISATGTGKTYASAFGIRDAIQPKGKILFLVHRKQILRQAKHSYKRVFGSSKAMALLTGEDQDFDLIEKADVVFSMITMMSKDRVLQRFSQEEFSCIVVDEVHHASAPSYQKIMNYFRPDFWLGMTATPERTDEGNVYELFDYNIIYEIRLQQALENDLLCPFHYFGITDLEIDGKVLDDESDVSNFRYLICDDRVEYILQQAKYYGHSGDRVKGLIFCSRNEEAKELSIRFNQRGYRTVALSAETKDEVREDMMDRLTSDERQDVLDYIFTVGIFNEGVDLPEVNQVIMLRPTESPIVFVQQLGRGLRKAPEKEYVVILDFIGNYKKNYLIPIALSGDRSYNKDNVRRYLMEGNRVIPGCSTIHFDEISRKRIYEAIDTANFSDLKLIKENYKNLKDKLGRIPGLMDFDRYGEMDVLRIFDNHSLGSYYKFLKKYEKEYTVRLSEREEKVIEFISKKLANGKRIHEIEMLGRLLSYRHGTSLMEEWKEALQTKYRVNGNSVAAQNVTRVLMNEFPAGSGRKTYEDSVFLEAGEDGFEISPSFSKMLENSDFKKMVRELVEFARFRYERDYTNRYRDTDFVLNQKYTYEDVCRLLGWDNSEVPLNIGGYKYDKKTKTFPVFINYDKAEDIQDTVKYEDHFESPDRLIAISKSNRTLQSDDVQKFLHAKELGISVELFVRKNKDDSISKEFYYLGHMVASGEPKEFIMSNTTSSAVEIEWILETPVRSDLYEYITSK